MLLGSIQPFDPYVRSTNGGVPQISLLRSGIRFNLNYIELVHYRLYLPDDFASLYAIEELCFERPFRFGRRYMRELIESPTSTTWIAAEDDAMTGFAIVDCLTDKNRTAAYIQTIEVAPAYRQRGIASELLNRLESSGRAAGATMIWLHVDAHNESAIRLYQSRAYRQSGRREHYYARNRAAEIYVKALNSEIAE